VSPKTRSSWPSRRRRKPTARRPKRAGSRSRSSDVAPCPDEGTFHRHQARHPAGFFYGDAEQVQASGYRPEFRSRCSGHPPLWGKIGAMQLNYIANAGVPSSSGRLISVIDPSDGQPFDELQRSNAQDIDGAVQAARQCLDAVWSKLSAAERGRLLTKLSAKVAEHADELALIEQRDCGKPTKQAR